MSTRRSFLRNASLIGAASLTLAPTRAAAAWDRLRTPPGSAADRARDETYWARIAAQYRVSSDVTNLEGVSFGMIAVPAFYAAATHAVGQVFLQHFESGGTFLTFDPEQVRDHFRKEFEANGGKVVSEQSYSGGDTEFRPQLTTIKSSKPDVLFIPGFYTEVGARGPAGRDRRAARHP